MSRDSNGDYTLPAGVNPVVAGTTITDDWANTTLNDVATALTDSWDRQGRGAPLANLPMGSFKFTGMAAGSASTDSVRYGQVLNQDAVTIASASTVDLASNLQTSVTVSGTTTITSFGTGAAAGVRKFITFTGNLTITHGASLICPGATNLSITAGDSIEVRSEGSNIWRVTNYQTGGGLGTKLSSLAAATAANTIANSTFKQTWQWSFTNAADVGMSFYGSATSAGTGTIVEIKTAGAGNTPDSLKVYGYSTSTETLGIYPGSFLLQPPMLTVAGSAADCTIGAASANSGSGGVNGGNLLLFAGNGGNSGSTGGSIRLTAGSATPTNGAIELRDAGGGSVAKVTVNSTAVTLSGSSKTVLNTKHVFLDNTNGAPTISAGGGAGATIAGSDVAFEVTAGTGSPTSVTVTFANAWASAPQIVLVSTTQAGCRLNYTATTTTLQISTDSAWSSGTKICALVMGLQ